MATQAPKALRQCDTVVLANQAISSIDMVV